MREHLFQLFGWYGVIAVIVAYVLVSFEIIDAVHNAYLFLNISGSSGIFLVAIRRKDYQPAVVNLVWLLIGFMAVVRIILT